MKTLVISILLALLSFQPLLSQSYHPFPDSNATWCDERSDNGWPTNYYYFFYKTDGKSSINDTVYTVISDNYEQITCYLREENKKVFCRIDSDQPEFMMYNFDIEIGDTVLLPQNANGPYSVGYVEEADSLLIGTEYHKRYLIQCWEWHSMHFIEGVGSDLGLIYFDIPWVDVYGDLYCFSLNDTIYHTDGSGGKGFGNCWNYIGISENSLKDMNIYPNPASDYIHINYDEECKLELIDLTGRQCRQSLSNSMYVKDMEQGIYFLRVYSVTGTLLNQFKILKVNAR
jgi:hypothetical protein